MVTKMAKIFPSIPRWKDLKLEAVATFLGLFYSEVVLGWAFLFHVGSIYSIVSLESNKI